MRKHYIALVRKDPDSDYGVSFPDFPGAVTAARSLNEAVARAGEALARHVEGMAEDGLAARVKGAGGMAKPKPPPYPKPPRPPAEPPRPQPGLLPG